MTSPHKARELEMVLWLNPNLLADRRAKAVWETKSKLIQPPRGFEGGWVEDATMEDWRPRKEIACADIVVTTHREDGTPAVIATMRAPDTPFGGVWWMQGGSYGGYESILDFVKARAKKECGVEPELEALIGFFRTCAEDFATSTTQPCYVGYVNPKDLGGTAADKDHTAVRLLTVADLDALPDEEKHPYALICFHAALTSMPG